MKILKLAIVLCASLLLNNCASGYDVINPKNATYNSSNTTDEIVLDYKYESLNKKYAKKADKKGIKLVSIKITNNSNKDFMFGKDVNLIYENGNQVNVMDNDAVFKEVKQSTPSYLLYLLLSPLSLYTTETNSNGFTEAKNIFPIGLILGPGLAGGNMIAAGSANKKFKSDLNTYNFKGMNLPKGGSVYGIIGVRSENYDALTLKVD